MKYCAKCGKELVDEAIACTNCGCSVAPEANVASEINNTAPEADTAPEVNTAPEVDVAPETDTATETNETPETDAAPVAADAPQKAEKKFSWGWFILGFFIPILGLILFLAWEDTKPCKAKSVGKGALAGAIVDVVLIITGVVACVAGIALLF